MNNHTEWTDGTEDSTSPWAPLPGVRTGLKLTKGERAADTVRNKMGSWGFVIMFCIFMAFWAITNTFVLKKNAYDPYPYILLNLFLSMLAGLQGAILLIAAKRADAVAAEQALSHLTISKTSSEIIHRIETDLAKNTKLTNELHKLNKELRELLKEDRGK
jgi:uncharacterized membrane protein